MAKAKASTKLERFDTVASPKGIAGFSFLVEPDEKFDAKHRIQIFVDKDDPQVKAFVKLLMETKAKFLKSIGKKDDGTCPGLKKADSYLAQRFAEHGIKEGHPYFEFTTKPRKDENTGEWIPVEIRDVKNVVNPELRVFGGDIIRCSVTLAGYNTGKESGIKPYLNAVQILQKKSGAGARINPFTDESATYGAPEEANDPLTDMTSSTMDDAAGAEESTTEAQRTASTKSTKGKAKAPKADEGEVNLDDIL
jgi:hypothetical protein